MTNEPIIYIDRSTITSGATDELRAMATELVEFVREQEPRLISYGFVINPEAGEMTVAAVHPDVASLELHLEIGGPRFTAIGRHIKLESIEVFGQLNAAATEALRQKARTLGGAEARFHRLDPGFARPSSGPTR